MIYTVLNVSDYKGLDLYSEKKSSCGFYLEILEDLHKIMRHAVDVLQCPKMAHIVIDSPKVGWRKELGRIIKRWSKSRQDKKGISSSESFYLAVLEKKPRAKDSHVHVAVIFDGLVYEDLIFLKEKLENISENRKVKICKRSREFMGERVKMDTGEIVVMGSKFYHGLNYEFDDAFRRNSYLAKVFSKSEDRDRHHLVSRI